MTELILTVSMLTIIAVFASMVIDKRWNKIYLLGFILAVIAGTVLSKYFIPSSGGVALAVVQGIMIYVLSKNIVYATYMTYVVYTAFYFGDLFAGVVYVVLLKIDLVSYFSRIQGLLIFGTIMILFSIPIILLLRLITSKILRFKEIEISNKAKIVMYTFTPLALFVHAFIANRTQKSGVQEEILKQALVLSSASVVIFMFGIYCILSTSIKKDVKKGKELENMAKNLSKEEMAKVIEIYNESEKNNK